MLHLGRTGHPQPSSRSPRYLDAPKHRQRKTIPALVSTLPLYAPNSLNQESYTLARGQNPKKRSSRTIHSTVVAAANPSHASARHYSSEKPICTAISAWSLPKQIAQSTKPKLWLLKAAGSGLSTAQASLLFALLSQSIVM